MRTPVSLLTLSVCAIVCFVHQTAFAALGDDAGKASTSESISDTSEVTASSEHDDNSAQKDEEQSETTSATQSTEKKSEDNSLRLSVSADSGADASSFSGYEDPLQRYHFIGLRMRLAYVPKFMFSLFAADGGKGVFSPSIGIEYASRRGNFEWVPWLAYASYAMGDVAVKAKTDPDDAYEIVNSTMKSITGGVDAIWSFPIHPKGLSFTLGGGVGVGVVFGNLYRTQAYPKDGNPSDVGSYVKCTGPGQPHPYCGNDNNHYGDYQEPSWFDGGSKPVVFPWIAIPQIGLRYKPHRRFVMRFDTGLSIPGPFFFGLSGQYGI